MSVGRYDRYGKVFVRKKSESTLGGRTGSYELVEHAKFSNLQLNIVEDREGTEKETYKSLQGKQFSVGVLGQLFKIPFPLGMCKFINEDLFDQGKHILKAFFVQFGLVDKSNNKDYLSVGDESGGVDYFLWPLFLAAGKHAENLEFLMGVGALLYIDDMMEAFAANSKHEKDCERQSMSEKGGKLPYKLISKLTFSISQEYKSNNEELDSVFERFERLSITGSKQEKIILRGCAAVYRDSVKAGKKYGCSYKGALEELATWISNILLESSSEWKVGVMGNADKAAIAVPIIPFMRYTTVAGAVTLETLLLHRGIQLDDELRSCPAFQLLKTFVGKHFQTSNDFFSFDKEMRSEGNDWRNNEGCMHHKTKGISVEEAKSQLVQNANETLDQIVLICEMLLDSYKDDQNMGNQVKLLVREVYHAVTVVLQGHAFISRYYKDLTMDCYVDE